jgi:Trypsin-like serine proteases, typically periplasmic, contain C-terminal PDZ domain
MKKNFGYIITAIISIAVGVVGSIIILDPYINKKTEILEKKVSEINITEADTLKTSISKIYDAVVVVEGYSKNNLVSSGSGFVYKIDDNFGYMITNNHVVENCTSVRVLNNEGTEIEANILGTDIYLDIAVLRIDKEYVLQVASLGNSELSEIGDTVFTVGSPNGREYLGTVTKGIISGLNREVTVSLSKGYYIMDVIQTDAAINPGNSGGPLVNINGEVIGINSLKLVKDEIEGMGFAIPIEEVLLYVDRLEAGKEIERPVIGVELIDVSSRRQQEYYQITIDSSIKEGAIIYKTVPNSAAQVAGLQIGDVIIKVNGVNVTDSTHFRYLLYKNNVGDTINITYNRNGKENTINVKLTK